VEDEAGDSGSVPEAGVEVSAGEESTVDPVGASVDLSTVVAGGTTDPGFKVATLCVKEVIVGVTAVTRGEEDGGTDSERLEGEEEEAEGDEDILQHERKNTE